MGGRTIRIDADVKAELDRLRLPGDRSFSPAIRRALETATGTASGAPESPGQPGPRPPAVHAAYRPETAGEPWQIVRVLFPLHDQASVWQPPSHLFVEFPCGRRKVVAADCLRGAA